MSVIHATLAIIAIEKKEENLEQIGFPMRLFLGRLSLCASDTSGSQNKFDLQHEVIIYHTSPLFLANKEKRHSPFTACPSGILSNFVLRKELLLLSGYGCGVSLRRKKWLKNEDLSHCSSDLQISWKDTFIAGGQGSVIAAWPQPDRNPS